MGSKVIRDHWFRPDEGIGSHPFTPCARIGCGRPQNEHAEAVGEWTDPRHLFLPVLRKRAGASRWLNCGRCNRHWSHSTHRGSKKNRSLYWDRWNGFWDAVRRRK